MKNIREICFYGGPRFNQWIKSFEKKYDISLNVFGHEPDYLYYLNSYGEGFEYNRINPGLSLISIDTFLSSYQEECENILKRAHNIVDDYYSII